MKINGTVYNNKEIETVIFTAISITPDASMLALIDETQPCITTDKARGIALFKSEGKYIVVAKPPEGSKCSGYILVNKHAFKKVKADYVDSNRAEELARQFAPRYDNRNRNNRNHYNGGHANDNRYQQQSQGNQGY